MTTKTMVYRECDGTEVHSVIRETNRAMYLSVCQRVPGRFLSNLTRVSTSRGEHYKTGWKVMFRRSFGFGAQTFIEDEMQGGLISIRR